MKRNHLYQTILLVGSILLASCRSTNYLTLSVQEPAPVYVPASIKKVGILDQTLPSNETKKIDDLDKILSVEGKNLDRDGAYAAATGLFDELSKNNRFTNVVLLNEVSIKSPGMGIMPAALPWTTVQQICTQHQVDALFVLSFYDTDTHIDYTAIPVEINGPLGVKIPGLEQQATVTTLIKTGWRIYDPTNKTIVDEYTVTKTSVLTGRGLTPLQAAQAILGRKEAVVQLSSQIGQQYAYRILPYSIRVSRTYYVRGTDNFKIAKRRAQTGNWDGAAELWQKEVTNASSKIAGRATYNMAISNEINGDLDTAVKWASQSYSDYGNKLALQYLRVLKNRIATNDQLRRETQE